MAAPASRVERDSSSINDRRRRRHRFVLVALLLEITLVLAALVITAPVASLAASAGNPSSSAGSVRFELNQGQSNGAVRFIARGAGSPFYLTSTDAVMVLTQPPALATTPAPSAPVSHGPAPRNAPLAKPVKKTATGAVVHLHPVGASSDITVTGEGQLPGVSNYLVGKDPKNWHTNVRSYSAVRYHNVYPGIDLVFHGGPTGGVEYDFEVAPGANASAISVDALGADRIHTDDHGALTIDSAGGSVTEPKPTIYQQINGSRQDVSGGFTSRGGNKFGFSVGRHDRSKPVVIDPQLVYSTYLGGDVGVTSGGGSGNDGNAIAVDSGGHAYVTGRTFAPDFPTTTGAFQTDYFVNPNNPFDQDPSYVGTYTNAFVSKLTPDGSGLVYSTYLGGSGGGSFNEGDVGTKIRLDSSDDAYVVGRTDSPDFPTTATALQPSQPGAPTSSFSGFFTKLSADGSQLLYSTYFNGIISDLAVDSAGKAAFAGSVSPGFTTTANTYQATCNVCADLADGVATSGSTTFTSASANFTYLDVGSQIFDDSSGTIIPCCGTRIASVTDPHTVVLDTPAGDGGTTSFTIVARNGTLGWVGEVDPSRSGAAGLAYSSIIGADYGRTAFRGIAVDAAGKILVTGTTSGLDFPTTAGAAQSGCRSDCPFNHDGVTTNGSTTFTSASAQFDANVDGGQIIQSPNIPPGTTIAAVDSSTQVTLSAAATAGGSGADFFMPSRQIRFDWVDREYTTGVIAKLDPTVAGTSSLSYSTYLGGSGLQIDGQGGDVPSAIAVDSGGNAYVTGTTSSPDFPTTSGAFSQSCNLAPGAACRGLVTFHDGVTTAGSTAFTSQSADFVASDVRRNLVSQDILGPGQSFTYPNVVDSATQIELSAPAATSATGVTFTLARQGITDAFVTKINAGGTSFVSSTFLGGGGSDVGGDIAVDSAGRASVVGGVGSNDFPLDDPVAPYAARGAFVTQLTPNASSLVYSTTIGGNGTDQLTGIAVDPAGATYVVGLTSSTDFPTTPGALKTQTLKSNAVVAKIQALGSSVPVATGLQPTAGPLGGGTSVTITGHGFTGASAVHFGSAAATFTVNSDAQVTASSPAQAAYGPQLVTVTTPGGTSPGNPIDRFTYTEGIWSPAATSPTGAPSGATATELKNGKVLVAGGTDTNGTGTACELFDPVSGTWSSAAPLNAPHVASTATLLADGRVLVVGGESSRSGLDSLQDAEIYDPTANTWTTVAPLTLGRFGHTATLLNSGQVLVTGGFSFSAPSGDLTLISATVYDPAANAWSDVGNLPIGVFNHTATLLPDGRVLIAGGSHRFAAQAAAYLYDPTRRIFETTGSMGSPRLGHTATMLPNGQVLVTGGSNDSRSPALNTEEVYDPSSGTWSLKGLLLAGRMAHNATLLDNGKVLITGGVSANSRGVALPSAELYDIATSHESSVANMSVARGGSTFFGIFSPAFTATKLSNGPCGANCGRVLVTGDSGDASADLYTPPPTVTGVSPNFGPTTGGTTVTVTGTGFVDVGTGSPAVKFGGSGASNVHVQSYTQLTAVSPPGSAGIVDVTVTADGGSSTPNPGDQFGYGAPPPCTGCPDNSKHLYTLDGYGGLNPDGSSPNLSLTAYWAGWDIARGATLFADGAGGYVLDGYGGVHAAGNAPGVAVTAYWGGWDIARGIVLAPWATKSNPQGYVLDGYGGVHPFGGAPSISDESYWPGFDIARGIVLLPGSTPSHVSGYTLDGYGGVHAFGGAPSITGESYWAGWDIARSIALVPRAAGTGAQGYVLDGYGGIHPFGGAPEVASSSYWGGWDIARGMTMWTAAPSGQPGGWLLDGYGGVHPFGTAPEVDNNAYWLGWDIARSLGTSSQGSGGRHH